MATVTTAVIADPPTTIAITITAAATAKEAAATIAVAATAAAEADSTAAATAAEAMSTAEPSAPRSIGTKYGLVASRSDARFWSTWRWLLSETTALWTASRGVQATVQLDRD